MMRVLVRLGSVLLVCSAILVERDGPESCPRLLPNHDQKAALEVFAHLGGDESLGGSPRRGARDMAPRGYARDVRVYRVVSRKTNFCRVATDQGNRVGKFARIQIAPDRTARAGKVERGFVNFKHGDAGDPLVRL
jgi:hypothetical protein